MVVEWRSKKESESKEERTIVSVRTLDLKETISKNLSYTSGKADK